MIAEIKAALQTPRSILQLAHELECSVSEITQIVELWMNKGKITGFSPSRCANCPIACNKNNVKLLIWKGACCPLKT